MRFSKKNLPKTRADLDRFVHDNNLIPVGVEKYRSRNIYIAETRYANDRPIEFPMGFYQVAWFVNKNDSEEKLDVGRGIDFCAFHDLAMNWDKEGKRSARIRTAIKDAESWIDTSIEAGRLDG